MKKLMELIAIFVSLMHGVGSTQIVVIAQF